MKYIVTVLYISICSILFSYAQEANQVFFEKGPNNMIRFYFDMDYYLVDKNCEFKYIERVAGFDLPSNKLHGNFKDFDPFGRTLLSGNYDKGSKEGEFTAYYPDGTLKWQTTFVKNIPQGKIAYFYPDGKPMLELTSNNNNFYINQYWDKTGKQSLKDGEGSIDITLPIMGYTEHGYTKYNLTGNVNNGKQNGLWRTSFVTDGKKAKLIPLSTSLYDNGVESKKEISPLFQDILIDLNSLSYSPLESFPNGELLQSKKCSFDEHSGFNTFIAQKFSNYLNINNLKIQHSNGLSITYKIRVTKNGEGYAATITESSKELSKDEKIILESMINQINYYLPSYLDNKPIEDRISISFQIQNNGTNNSVAPVQINREKGF